MSEDGWHHDRLDLTEYLPDAVLEGSEERIVCEVRVWSDLAGREREVVAEYLRGLADGIDPTVEGQSGLEE
ncbi:hypothetical protein [Halorubellus litoreus]|uniref:Uncharacterized protein n=1 Tax=Halorubellus litoreus TaxID=755308 RepID=A0ABD5VNY4_9EURY